MIKSILSFIQKLSIQRLLIVFGVVFIAASLFSYDGTKAHFADHTITLPLLYLGGLILFFCLVFYSLEFFGVNSTKKLRDGLIFKTNSINVKIIIDKIENADITNKDSAFIFPVNNTFVDDCITDKKAALGSFFLKHKVEKIPQFTKDVQELLEKNKVESLDKIHYPTGTFIMLPSEYDTPAKVILVASSVKNHQIKASPTILSQCIYNIFKETADKKIDKLIFPLLGAGHGGIESSDAFRFLTSSIKYQSKYFHHIKDIEIYIIQSDRDKIILTYF